MSYPPKLSSQPMHSCCLFHVTCKITDYDFKIRVYQFNSTTYFRNESMVMIFSQVKIWTLSCISINLDHTDAECVSFWDIRYKQCSVVSTFNASKASAMPKRDWQLSCSCLTRTLRQKATNEDGLWLKCQFGVGCGDIHLSFQQQGGW